MAKKLISEQTILDASKRGEKVLHVSPGTVITDAARDRAKQLGIRLESGEKKPVDSPSPPGAAPKRPGTDSVIAIGSDHGGFQMKESLMPFIEHLGYTIVDLGTYNGEACDYPDFAYAVARMVSLGDASRGIMIDSIGIASAIVANKLRGIRAACCFDEFSARSSREHNNANVLTLGGKVLGIELAKAITSTWLDTAFGGGRHQKRLEKISDIEARHIT